MAGFRDLAVTLGLAQPKPIDLHPLPGVDPNDPVLRQVDESILSYDQRAKRSMRDHFLLRSWQMIFASAIPVCQVLWAGFIARATGAILGALVAVLQGIDTLHHYEEHYSSWRSIAHQLLRERHLFSIRASAYAAPPEGYDAKRLLAERADAILALDDQQGSALAQTAPPAR